MVCFLKKFRKKPIFPESRKDGGSWEMEAKK